MSRQLLLLAEFPNDRIFSSVNRFLRHWLILAHVLLETLAKFRWHGTPSLHMYSLDALRMLKQNTVHVLDRQSSHCHEGLCRPVYLRRIPCWSIKRSSIIIIISHWWKPAKRVFFSYTSLWFPTILTLLTGCNRTNIGSNITFPNSAAHERADLYFWVSFVPIDVIGKNVNNCCTARY